MCPKVLSLFYSVIVCFVIKDSGTETLQIFDPETPLHFWISLGYIIHHSFISFFFWMNAMAVNITYKFSNLLTTHAEERHERSIVSSLMYAQGLPLLITLAIGIIDIYGSCDSVIPNIGRYSCFLGSLYDPDKLFIQTAEFFYFYLIIMIIVISNTICFIITGYFLTINWSTVRRMQTR